MKKFFTILLITVMIISAVIMEGTTVFAEEALKAEVWSPVEITLESTTKYANPYSDVEVDAVFTHSDGTVITLPGFWKEKDTFAVRFSPTKTGEWSYKITSNDSTNESLNKEGKITASETTKDLMLTKHGFVRTEKGKSHFMYDDGTPFLWIGDTHWQAPNYEQTNVCNYPQCNCYNQFKHEVDNRKAKGFNVYQTYFDAAENDGGGQKGKVPSIWDEYLALPSAEIFNTKIDYMFQYIYESDMVLALGFGVHGSTPRKMNVDQLKLFARYCVARYACYSIAWITAQEMTRPDVETITPGMSVYDVWCAVAEYVYELDGYKHPNSGHMDAVEYGNKKAYPMNDLNWHTYWASQAGHGTRCFSSKKRYQAYVLTGKPVVEAEYNYEDINCGGFASYDLIRFGAWNAFLNGCTGYTYGATGIWANCYSTEGNVGWYGQFSSYNYDPWYMGLDKPGSFDVMYLNNFFNTINDWTALKARYSDVTYGDFLSDDKKLLASTEDSSTYVAYFMNKNTSTGTLYKLDPEKTYKALWFNPITGKFIEIESGITGQMHYDIPEKTTKGDWVFLLTSEPMKSYKVEAKYTQPTPAADIGKLVIPYKVTAVGGAIYKDGRLHDNSNYLYDNSGVAAWEPNSDRSTQTIIYDLGAVYDVTQMNIVPANGTVLPDYRIEGSNDGWDWTIIVNTENHDPTMSADGTYHQEALAGTYRYIKLLLLNADPIGKAAAAEVDYMLVYNEKSGGEGTPEIYSHTAISEISVFALKQSESIIVPSVVVTPQPAGEQDNGGVSVSVKAVPVIITAVVAVALIATAVFVPLKKKKDE